MEPENKKTTVMIVEDDMDVRALLKLELSQRHHVVEFRHGKTALEFLDEGNRPDLILSDLAMPRVDGMTMIHEIRKRDWGHDIPILILTGLTSDDDVPAHVWKEGTSSDEFLEKPLRPGELLFVVQKWIDRYEEKRNTPPVPEVAPEENGDDSDASESEKTSGVESVNE